MNEGTVSRGSSGGGVLSRGFSQPPGEQVVPGEVRGYYLDMRVKARDPRWPPKHSQPLDRQLYVDTTQWGLATYEHFLATGREEWLAGAVAAANHLVETQVTEGRQRGGWVHGFPYPHTFPLRPDWISAMAQGQAASLLVRVFGETGDERFAEAARLAQLPLTVPVSEGGVRTTLAGGPFYEEYPTNPSSQVLNGAIFTLWGCHDLALALDDASARELFERGAQTLSDSIDRWDTGWWSRYDLFPHPLRNIASQAYHELHIDQLTALHRLAPHEPLRAAAERFRGYAESRSNAARALASKVAFRLAVPRNEAFARRLPWSIRP